MNSASLDRLGTPETEAPTDAYQLELNAVQNHLNADSSDLIYLLTLVFKQNISNQQIQGLLEQAYTRLQTLRKGNTELAALTSDTELVEAIKQAGITLGGGEALSLSDVDKNYEQAYRRCRDMEGQSEVAARIRAEQGLVAAAMLNYRHAAALYAEAASINHHQQWHYLAQQALILEELGREFIDIEALQAAVDLYQNSILSLLSKEKQADDWAGIQNALGNTLGVLGQRHRGTRMLEEAITAFENSLTVRDRERTPVDWASTQNGLGNALGILAQRQRDEEMLEKSIAAFEAALEVRNAEQSPEEWATTQNNLAAVLLSRGQQKKDSKMLKRAVEAYRGLLTVWEREQRPLIWAAAMNNLGSALRLLGEYRKGPRTLEQSVAAYNAALSVRTRDRVPDDWAMTQNNLGAALQVLAERVEDPLILGKSVAAYRETIKQWSKEKEPMRWAMTLANLGVARRKLAEVKQDIDISKKACADLKKAVDVFRGASHAQLTELGEEQLSLSRKLTASLMAEIQE